MGGGIMFQTRLRELREAAGYKSQQAFADVFGVVQSTVGNWEAGRREPNYETMMRLADFFHVSVDYLLGRTDDPSPVGEEKEPTPEAGGGLDPELVKLIKQVPDNRMPEVERYLRFQATQKEKP